MAAMSPEGPTPGEAGASAPAARQPGGYLDQLDFYRVVACACVVGQHAFLWTVAPGNDVAWAFVFLLHLSRYAFFFRSALVVCYAQVTRPRSPLRFWKRRYVQMGVPYLTWTAIYFVFTLFTVSGSRDDAPYLLWHYLLTGYFQLYFVVVLFQLYLVVPGLLWLLRRTRHHLAVLSGSVAFALFLAADMHYSRWFGPIGAATRWIGSGWPWALNPLTYQAFFVGGALVALHLDWVVEQVRQRYRQIVGISLTVGVAVVVWYVVEVSTGSTTGRASDLFQPIAVVWFAAAIAALFCLGWWWDQRTRASTGWWGRRVRSSVTYLAELTGGVFLCHVLFVDLIRSALTASGLRDHLSWAATTAVLFVGTVVLSSVFAALVLRTPVRWALGGPVRSDQRARVDAVAARAAELARAAERAGAVRGGGEPVAAAGRLQ